MSWDSKFHSLPKRNKYVCTSLSIKVVHRPCLNCFNSLLFSLQESDDTKPPGCEDEGEASEGWEEDEDVAPPGEEDKPSVPFTSTDPGVRRRGNTSCILFVFLYRSRGHPVMTTVI